MFEKSFIDMLRVDVSKHIKQRDGQDYLPWAACKKLLHDNGAEVVMFWPVPGPDGSTLRKSDMAFSDKNGVQNRVYEVLVHIQVDGLEWETAYPVLNGNNPVKDNSMSQLRVHNAIRRAFVKGVAERTGLGFSLWLAVDDLPDEVDDLSKHSIMKVKQRVQELVTAKINQGIPLTVIADRLGRTEEEVRSMFGWYGILNKLEKINPGDAAVIASQDRSGWFGASDTAMICGNWDTKTFKNWWLTKLGLNDSDFSTTAMNAGTYYEHAILETVGAQRMDHQILLPDLSLRVNLDGDGLFEIYEVKTHKVEKPYRPPKAHLQQVWVQMYAKRRIERQLPTAMIVAYGLTEEDYKNFFNEIDKERLQVFQIIYDEAFIDDVYLPRLRYLHECLKEGVFPDVDQVDLRQSQMVRGQ